VTSVATRPDTRSDAAPDLSAQERFDVRGMSVVFGRGTAKRVHALDDIDFSVEHGEFVSLIGPSGCGKSTLLNVLGGLLPPTSGDVLVDGEPWCGIPEQVGYMFQKDTLLPWKSVLDNAVLPLRLRKAPDEERARELLGSMGLGGFENSYPHELSGGMRTRVELARLLLQDPSIILMDEPFGALDAQTKLLMQEEFLRHWDSHRKTIVLVTHDLQEALFMSNRVVLMGARPGHIRREYTVDLPRPRVLDDVVATPEYRGLFQEIWSTLREQLQTGEGQWRV
jgi:NitT/TauT family transport system ATP-binding protein